MTSIRPPSTADTLTVELRALAGAIGRAQAGAAALRRQWEALLRQDGQPVAGDGPEPGDHRGRGAAVGQHVEVIEIHLEHMVQHLREATDTNYGMMPVSWALRGLGREATGAGQALIDAGQAAHAIADGKPAGPLAHLLATIDQLLAQVIEIERHRVAAWSLALDSAAQPEGRAS